LKELLEKHNVNRPDLPVLPFRKTKNKIQNKFRRCQLNVCDEINGCDECPDLKECTSAYDKLC
jgi:hypothetical protein